MRKVTCSTGVSLDGCIAGPDGGLGYRLAAGGLAEEVERWRATPGQGDIVIGGPRSRPRRPRSVWSTSTGSASNPVLVGGGTPFFPRAERRENLDLVDSRTFDSGVVHLRYRVSR